MLNVFDPGLEAYMRYYSDTEAFNMLPLVVSYSKDIEKCFSRIFILTQRSIKISRLLSVSTKQMNRIADLKENIKNKIELLIQKYGRYEQELAEMHIGICKPMLGRLNIPVYNAITRDIVYICVHPDVKSRADWHLESESHEDARPYWPMEYNNLCDKAYAD